MVTNPWSAVRENGLALYQYVKVNKVTQKKNKNNSISEMRCSTPVAPTDGYIQIRNFTGVYRYGTVANFLCNPGYQLIGDQSRYEEMIQ